MSKFQVVEPAGAQPIDWVIPAASDSVVVPDAHLLFAGSFKRIGADLLIEGGGKRALITDYFATEHSTPLLSPEGAQLDTATVRALAGVESHWQFAQAGGTSAVPAEIGTVRTISGTASVQRGGSSQPLTNGSPVFQGDVVQTGTGSSLGIILKDNTVFSLSADARMVMNQLVYDASRTDNTMSLSLVQGSFVFITGQVAKTGSVQVTTPVATMGIRGTAPIVELSTLDGSGKFKLVQDPDAIVGNYILYRLKAPGEPLIDPDDVIARVNDTNTVVVIRPGSTTAEINLKSLAESQNDLLLSFPAYELFKLTGQRGDLQQPYRRAELDGSTGKGQGAEPFSYASLDLLIPLDQGRIDLLGNTALSQQFQFAGLETRQFQDTFTSTGGLVPSTLRIDLDPGATGSNRTAVFTENGSLLAVSPVTQFGLAATSQLSAATVILRNPQAGDSLFIGTQQALPGAGGTLPGGIQYSFAFNSIDVILTGVASVQAYQDAIASIRFINTSDAPDLQVRIIDVTVTTATGQTATATTFLAIEPVNDAPINNLPTAQAAAEDGAIVFSSTAGNAITVSDVDAGTGAITVTLTVQGGVLGIAGSVITGTGVSVAGNGTGALVVTGSQAAINAALDGLRYSPDADFNGTDAIIVSTNDNGGFGTGGALTTTSPGLSIAISAVNDAPTWAVANANYAATEQTALELKGTGLGIGDVDASGGNLTVTLTVAQGILTADTGTSGVAIVSGSGTSALTVSGSLAQINAFLGADSNGSSLSYLNTSDDPAANTTLTLEVNDNGNSGAGGSLIATTSVSISIGAINDAPVLAPVPPVSIADTAAIDTFTAITGNLVGTDDDQPGGAPLTYGLASGVNGTSAFGTLAVQLDGAYAFTPNATAINALASGTTASVSYQVTVTDSEDATGTTTITFNFTGANDRPVAVAETRSFAEDTIATGNVVTNDTDVDGGPLTVTSFKVDGFFQTAGLLTVFNPGTSVNITNVGSLTINADGSYTFAPVLDYSGPVPVATYTVSDGRGGTATAALSLNVTPVNDLPVNTVPGAQTTNATGGLLFYSLSGNEISIADTDADLSPIIVTLHVDHGTLTVNDFGGGVVITGNGTGTVTLTGAQNFIRSDLVATTYQATAGYAGTDTLTVTTNDQGNTGAGGAQADIDTVAITVLGAPNNPPTSSAPGFLHAFEDAEVTIGGSNTLSVNDIDGGSLTVTLSVGNGIVTIGTTSGLTIVGNGTATATFSGSIADLNTALDTVSYTPVDDYNGPDTLTFTTSDGIAPPVVKTIAISITADPDITADTITVSEDASITFNVLTGTNGATPDTFEGSPTVTGYTNAAHGGLTVAADGTVTYTPVANYNGPDSFTYTVTSGGVTETATVTFNVTPVNDAPVITSGTFTGTVFEDLTTATTATGRAFAADPDIGDTQTWTVVGGTPAQNASFQFYLDQLQITKNGNTGFVLDTYSDGVPPPSGPLGVTTYTSGGGVTEAGGRAVFDSVNGFNGIGVGTPDPFITVDAIVRTNINPTEPTRGLRSGDDFTVQGTFDLATPDDLREAYGIRLTDRVIGGDGSPPDNQGDDVIELTVREGRDGIVRVQLREFDFAADDVTNIASAAFTPPAGAVQIRLILTHAAATNGQVFGSFEYLNSSGAVVGSVSFATPGQIFGTETPSFTGDNEDYTRAQIIAYTPVVTASTLDGTYGRLAIEQDGTWTYALNNALTATQSLAAGQTVLETFNIRVTDAAGASDTRPLTVTVTGSNDAPVLTSNANVTRTLSEDQSTPNLTATGLTQFADVDLTDTHTLAPQLVSSQVSSGDPIPPATLALLGSAVTATLTDPATGDSAGVFQWDFALANSAVQFLGAGEQLTLVYQIAVTDPSGTTAVQTVTIMITGINDVPVTAPVTLTAVAEDSVALPITQAQLLTNATDIDGPLLTATNLAIATGGGVLLDNNDSTWTYTPAANDDTQVSFTYTVTDGTLTAAGSATLDITPVNDAPGGTDKTIGILEDTPYTLTAADFGFTDPDDVPANALTSVIITSIREGDLFLNGTVVSAGAEIGVADIANGNLVFLPEENYVGTNNAYVRFEVRDNGGTANGGVDTDQSPDTITFNITPVNDAPTSVAPPSISTAEDAVALFTGANTLSVNDVDSEPLTITLAVNRGLLTLGTSAGLIFTTGGATAAAAMTFNGTQAAIIAALATLSYAPAADYNAAATLTFTTSDGSAPDVIKTIAINVTAVADIANDTASTSGVLPVTITVLGNDTFEGSTPLIAAIQNQAVAPGGTISFYNGSVTLNNDGTITFTPTGGAAGTTVNFDYTVASGGVTETATVSVAVAPSSGNHAPIALPDAAGVSSNAHTSVVLPGGTVSGNLLTQLPADYDPDAGDTIVLARAFDATTSAVAVAAGASPTTIQGIYGALLLQSDGTYTYTVHDRGNSGGNYPLDALVNVDSYEKAVTEVFTYEIADTAGLTAQTTLSLTIGPRELIPNLLPDRADIDYAALVPATGNVLSNDTFYDFSPASVTRVQRGDELDIAAPGFSNPVVLTGLYGVLTIDAYGVYSYAVDTANFDVIDLGTASAGFTLTDAFNYTAGSGGVSGSSNLVITIRGPNSQALAQPDVAVTNEVICNLPVPPPIAGDVLANDDPGLQYVLSIAHEGFPSPTVVNIPFAGSGTIDGNYGSLTIDADGGYVYVVDQSRADFLQDGVSAFDVFTYEAYNDNGPNQTTTLTIKIDGIDDPIVATPQIGTNVAWAAGDPPSPVTNGALALYLGSGAVDPDNAASVIASTIPPQVFTTGPYIVTLSYEPANDQLSVTNVSQYFGAPALTFGQTLAVTVNYMERSNLGPVNTSVTFNVVYDHKPVAVIDQVNLYEAGIGTAGTPTLSGNVLTNDFDADIGSTSDAIRVTSLFNIGGTAAVPASGTVTLYFGSSASAADNYGTVAIDATGAYTVALNNTHPEIQGLADGQQIAVNAFSYVVTDSLGVVSNFAPLQLTITGANDTPVAVNDFAHAGALDLTVPVTGAVRINDYDIDNGDITTVVTIAAGAGPALSVVPFTSIAGQYGTLTIQPDGSYSYLLDAGNSTVTGLVAGATLHDVFTYGLIDRDPLNAPANTGYAAATLDIEIHGQAHTFVPVNDSKNAMEAGGVLNGIPGLDIVSNIFANETYTGTYTVVSIVNSFTYEGQVGTSFSGRFGTLLINADGAYKYAVDNNDSQVEELIPYPSSPRDHFDITVRDQFGAVTTQSLDIFIDGADDAPRVTPGFDAFSDTSATVKTYQLNGYGFASDPDSGGSPLVSNLAVATSLSTSSGTIEQSLVYLLSASGELSIDTYQFAYLQKLYDLTGTTFGDASGTPDQLTIQFTYDVTDDTGLTTSNSLDIYVAGTAVYTGVGSAVDTLDFDAANFQYNNTVAFRADAPLDPSYAIDILSQLDNAEQRIDLSDILRNGVGPGVVSRGNIGDYVVAQDDGSGNVSLSIDLDGPGSGGPLPAFEIASVSGTAGNGNHALAAGDTISIIFDQTQPAANITIA